MLLWSDLGREELLIDSDWFAFHQAAPERSVILLHACAHNPTGMDPSPEQWQTLVEIMKVGNCIPPFVLARRMVDPLVSRKEITFPFSILPIKVVPVLHISREFVASTMLTLLVGFATGDPDRDAQSVRLFVRNGFEMFVSQSFAKNMGLYGRTRSSLKHSL